MHRLQQWEWRWMWNIIEGHLITTSINKSYYFQVKVIPFFCLLPASLPGQDAISRQTWSGLPVPALSLDRGPQRRAGTCLQTRGEVSVFLHTLPIQGCLRHSDSSPREDIHAWAKGEWHWGCCKVQPGHPPPGTPDQAVEGGQPPPLEVPRRHQGTAISWKGNSNKERG